MNKERRAFDTTFKLEVVKLIKEQGLSVGQVCKDMGIGESAKCYSGNGGRPVKALGFLYIISQFSSIRMLQADSISNFSFKPCQCFL